MLKNTIAAMLGFLVLSSASSAFAVSLSAAVRKVQSTSSGKLIQVISNANLVLANGESVIVDVDSESALLVANSVCDLTKPFTFGNFRYGDANDKGIVCIGK